MLSANAIKRCITSLSVLSDFHSDHVANHIAKCKCKLNVFSYFNFFLQLTHAECVRVGHTGSDLHLTVRALGAGLAGFHASILLRICSRATDPTHSILLRATLLDCTVTAAAFGARRTQAMGAQKEEPAVAITLCVLFGRARGQCGDTRWALGAGKARVEVFRWRKCSWETQFQNWCQSHKYQ